MICEYGCGQKAVHQFKNGKWCCNKLTQLCPEKINQQSIKQKGPNSWKYGSKSNSKTKEKISLSLSGEKNPMYKKNFSEEHRRKISDKGKGRTFIMSKEQKNLLSKFKSYDLQQFYEAYPMLSKLEDLRYNPNKPEDKEIQAHCKNHNCKYSKENGGWFTPSRQKFRDRCMATSLEDGGGNYLYCSDKCKEECPLYGKRISQLINDNNPELFTNQEYQIFRKEVLNRSKNICEYCENPAEHVHHSRPQKLEPGFVLDPDFGIACCQECHYKYGHKTGTECSTGNLSNKICI